MIPPAPEKILVICDDRPDGTLGLDRHWHLFSQASTMRTPQSDSCCSPACSLLDASRPA